MLCGLLVLWPCGIASAESVYTVTEQELIILEQSLATLKAQRTHLQQEFLALKIQQETLDEQVTTLENQLRVAKLQSTDLENQLKTVNESFKQYAKEEKSKRLRIKAQRNFAYTLAASIVIGYTYKSIR